ncbi:MAG TPA: hypothetical protein VFS39_06150 [Nitrospira sp.]|nr:hypothetical protein [Nitrospira sp.]
MRFTNAFSLKQQKHAEGLKKGIIVPEDYYVLAINCQGIPRAAYGNTMPYFVQAFLPIGPLKLSFDSKTFELKDSFYSYRPEVFKANGAPVSTNIFLDEASSFCSAILHSSVDCANYPTKYGGDFAVLHNPRASHPVDVSVFDWCDQWKVRDDMLYRIESDRLGR